MRKPAPRAADETASTDDDEDDGGGDEGGDGNDDDDDDDMVLGERLNGTMVFMDKYSAIWFKVIS